VSRVGGPLRAGSIEIRARIGETVATLGFVPAIMPAVIAERNFDALDHHKRGVIKDARSWPGGRGAQKFVAARLFRYGRTTGAAWPTTLSEARGEGFAVEGRQGIIEGLETGGVRRGIGVMAIPFDTPYVDRKYGRGDWEEALARREFEIIPGRGLLVETVPGRKGGKGLRTEIVGTLKRSVKVRALLGFFKRWETNLPKVLAKYEADLGLMLDAAGREAAKERIVRDEILRRVGPDVYRQYIDANPRDHAGARRATRRAVGQVRRHLLARGAA
jgi:hypothetical protein